MGYVAGQNFVAGGYVKAPRFNAAIPVAPDKGHIGIAIFVGSAGADKQGAGVVVFIFVIAHDGQGVGVKPNAFVIGLAAGNHLPFAVADGNAGMGHGLACIQSSHPDE